MPSAASLVPHFDVAIHIVLDDFGKHGRSYRECDEARATFEDVVSDLLTGQFNNPLHIVAFNTSEGWSRDVSEHVAGEVAKRAGDEVRPLEPGAYRFVARFVDEGALLRVE